jgi:hypothetical protein
MMQAIRIIREAESLGVAFSVEGERLRITQGGILPLPQLEELKKNKTGVIKLLQQDDKARDAGFLPLIPFEVYEKQLTPNAHVFVAKNESGKWDVWRETFGQLQSVIDEDESIRKMMRKSNYVKVIVTNAATLDYALV